MGLDYAPKYCEKCEKKTKHFRAGTNHVLHLLLSIFTCGLWLIVWIGSCIKFGGWTCEECGK